MRSNHRRFPLPMARPHVLPGPRAITPSPVIQRRGYTNTEINQFLVQNPQGPHEQRGAYVTRITGIFKVSHQYHDRTDLNYLRDRAWNAQGHMAPYPGVIGVNLAGAFNNHVLGNSAGVGWHSESVNQNGHNGCSYQHRQVLAANKGTYFADTVIVAGTVKAGNNGRSTFFPATMSIADIRYEALYVANRNPQVGQIRRGRGPRSGIMIDCLINAGVVESAYPFKPGW